MRVSIKMGLIFCILVLGLEAGILVDRKKAGYETEETKELQCDTLSVISAEIVF